MKKTEKKQKKGANHAKTRPIIDASGTIDWTPLRSATKDALRWARDVAMASSRDVTHPARVAGVFDALDGLIDGAPYERVPLADVLLVVRVVGGAVERELDLAPGLFDVAAQALGLLASIDQASPARPSPTICHLAPRPGARVMRAPSSLAEVCALANRIAALVGPMGPLAAGFHH